MTATGRGRARRRWRSIALATLLMGAGLIAALPWVLELPAAQRRLAVEASKILAPGSVDFGAIHFSWFRPTAISGLVLRDKAGDRVVTAPRATFQWNLREILVNRPESATLILHQADLDIERDQDGTIDLYETLRPVVSDHPNIRLVIRIDNGRLKFRDPAIPEPVIADQADIDLDLGRASQPIAWNIRLAQAKTGAETPRLNIEGSYSRAEIDATEDHDISLSLKGTRWPWTWAGSSIRSRGDFTGTVVARRRSGRLLFTGDSTITDFVAIGELLSTDTIRLDKIRGAWNVGVGGADGAWTIERLELTTPLGSLKGGGSLPSRPNRAASLEGTINLAALARQLPATLQLREGLLVEQGTAQFHADLLSEPDGKTQIGHITGQLSDLIARRGSKTLTLRDPATVIAEIRLRQSEPRLQRLEVRTPYLSVSGQGDLDRGVEISGTVDLAAFRERVQDWIDLGTVELAGTGKLDGRYRREGGLYHANVGASFRDLRVGGFPMGTMLERKEITFKAEASGPAAPAGWPTDCRVLSLQANSGPNELKIRALNGADGGPIALDGHIQTQWESDGNRRQLEGDLKANWDQRAVTAERITLALVSIGRAGAGETVRWSARGRYDLDDDDLVIESTTSPASTITGRQSAHIKGVKNLAATQGEVSLTTDMASIQRWLSPEEPSWTGQVDALIRARREKDLWNLGLRLELSDLARLSPDGPPVGVGGDVVVGLNATYALQSDRLELTEMGIKAPYVQIEGSGSVGDLTRRPRVDLKGALSPDWARLNGLLARKIEPNARIAGRPRGWHLAGTVPSLTAMTRSWPGSLEGEVGIGVDSVDVFGMRLSETALVLRTKDGHFGIDPVDTTLNGGVLHLEPELYRDQDGSTWVRMGRSSTLEGALVNDEVSHRVLSFVAPVLDGATRVDGRISVELTEALLPIVAPPDSQATIEGDVVFDDVRFMPGPLIDQLLSVLRLERKPLLVLRDSISVRVADRKVHQEGLIIPVGKLATIGLDGSVDFDKNLDLIARIAMEPPRSNVPVLTPILKMARFELPIRGTLKNPKIDGGALKERLKSFGTDLLDNSLQVGVDSLQRLFQGWTVPPFRRSAPSTRRVAPARRPDPPPPPRPDPPAPGADALRDEETVKNKPDPPKSLTPDERKRLREQKREQRIAKRAERRLQRLPTPEK